MTENLQRIAHNFGHEYKARATWVAGLTLLLVLIDLMASPLAAQIIGATEKIMSSLGVRGLLYLGVRGL